MRWRALVLLAAGLAGCRGPYPTPPKGAAVTAPPFWRHELGSGATDARLDPHWWDRFGDPVIGQLVARALAHNPDLQSAIQRVFEAQAETRLALSAQLPHITGEVDGTGRAHVNGIDYSQYIIGGALSFDVDLFGRLREATRAARAQALATAADRDTVRLRLIADTVRDYVALRASDAALALLQDTLTNRQAEAARVRHQVAVGYAQASAAYQADSQVAATLAQIASTRLTITQQETALATLLGSPPADIPRGRPLMELPLPGPVAPIPARVLARRPDLISAADQIVAADHSLASARAAFLPDITLSPEIVTSAGGLQFSGTMWSVGGSLLAPIFVGGQLRANADIAASERDQAAWAYRAASLAAFAEVENALAAITRLAEQEQAAARLLDDNDRTLRDTKHRNSVGYTDYLTVLDAERTSLSSALDLIQIRAARLSQAATLYQAIGGG